MTVAALPEVEARHTPDALEREIVAFEEAIREFQSGSLSEDEWRRFRLTHGTYGQRQPGVQMLRVKIVAGLLSSEQLLALAEIADDYSTGRGHLTTRENVQFHFVQLANVPKAMRILAKAGLTTREACFNTVRNVTACPISGICPTEAFDVTPYALGISRFLLRHPDFNNLPRKFKIAFSGCEDDGNCAVAGIHDIGLIAQIRNVNGVEKRGFRVLVGGGLGSLPTEAALLTDFLPEEELLPTTEAVLRVFNEFGNRKNKMMARMKFLLRAKGIEEFRRMVAEKRKTVQTPAQVYTRPSSQAAPFVNISLEPLSAASSNGHSDPEYATWAKHNVMQQRQPGYAALWIKLPAGTLYSQQMRGLAKLLDFHKLPGMRIAINQDLVLPWVPTNLVHAIHDELRTLDLVTPGARTIADVTGCPGATTCNLGITRSLTLADVLAKELAGEADPEVMKMHIKISGCPNSCGQHQIADIGFYGNARKLGDRQIPYYQLLLGGKIDSNGVHFGRQVMAVPARPVPDIIRELISAYKEHREDGESFSDWAARTPDDAIIERLRAYSDLENAAADTFIDWGDTEVYSLKLGRGECAA